MAEDSLDYQQIIKETFNETDQSLNVTTVTGTVDNTFTNLDMEDIIKSVYDPNTKTLRVINVD